MKRRRGRRGFWWWSWLLVLTTAGGVVGGYVFGEKQWEEAPKEYLAVAKLDFKVRKPFVSKKAGVTIPTSGVANANELEVLRAIKSEEALSGVVSDLELTRKWGLGSTEAVALLRIAMEFDLDQKTDELNVQLRLTDPDLSAEVANQVADMIPSVIKQVDEANEAAAFALLEAESQPIMDREAEARAALGRALEANGIQIKLAPQVDLGPYLELGEVLTAKVAWDSAQEDLRDLMGDQAEYRNYWKKSLRPSLVVEQAVVPDRPVGPALKPFQVRWSTYGLTAGLMTGSILMLGCWKLFP